MSWVGSGHKTINQGSHLCVVCEAFAAKVKTLGEKCVQLIDNLFIKLFDG